MQRVEVGSKVERAVSKFSKHFGEVIQVGEGSNDGRVRVQWTHMIYTPVKWDGKISRKINHIPTGEPERVSSMTHRPKTWIRIAAITIV